MLTTGALALSSVLLVPQAARAEIEVGVFGGGKFYSDDGVLARRLAADKPETAFGHSGVIGLRLGYLPIPRLAIEGEIGISPVTTRGLRGADGAILDGSQSQAAVVPLRAHLLVNLLTGRIRPFVLLGGGGHISTQLSPGVLQTDGVGALHAGAGVTIGIKDGWGLRLDGRFLLAQGISRALVPEGELLLAFWGRFGHKPEAPAAPAPIEELPAPPTVEALAAPTPTVLDSDGDGVLDKEDGCPKQAGSVGNHGCPDSDGDGDGIVDRLDRCPDQAESKNGYEDQDGCPDELPKAVQQFTGSIQGVAFEAAQALLTPASSKVLDKAAQMLKDNASVKLEVAGHTDSSGDAEKNRDLSLRRAEAVVKYLTDKGIAAQRLKAAGYGPDKPAADNGTPEGRSKNRRVEFTLIP